MSIRAVSLAVILLAFIAIVGCSSYESVPRSIGGDRSPHMASRRLDDTTSAATPLPLPSGSIVPFTELPLKNYTLSSSQASQLIDPSLPTATRTILQSVLTQTKLPDYDPSFSIDQYDIAVIDGTTGNVYYNRPDLANSITINCPGTITCRIPLSPVEGNDYNPYEPKPNPGTGPYRRIVSDYNQAIPDTNGSIYEPIETGLVTAYCNDGNMVSPNFAGTIYMGGWSADATPPSGSNDLPGVSVDAGLQYNRRVGNTSDTYSPFMNLESIGYVSPTFANNLSGNPQQQAASFQYGCGTTIRNSYLVSNVYNNTTTSNVVLTETATGYDPLSARDRVVQIFYEAPMSNGAFNGWSESCQNCVFKYAVSIAQPQGQENLQDGSFFVGTWSQLELTCGFAGFSPSCGADSSDLDELPWNNGTTLRQL